MPPQPDASAITSAHYRRIAELAERLSARHLTIFRHEYDYLAFGSWRVVAGSRTRWFRFTWDGKDGHLEIEAAAAHGGRAVSWSQFEIPQPLRRDSDPFEVVQAVLETQL